MKKKDITLLDSRAWLNDENYSYEEYLDFCEVNYIEPHAEDSDDFFNWRISMCSEDFSCDMGYLEDCEQFQYAEFIVTGCLGLWNGNPEIVPMKVTGLANAIQKCFSGCDDAEAVYNPETGVISVNAYHHDGCNCFEIRQLRDYCSGAFDRAYESWDCGESPDIVVKDGWLKKIANPYKIA